MKTQTSLQFGIEIELLLGSRKKAHSSWKSLAKDVSTRLAAAGIANHINQGNDKAQDHYREWSVVQEVTIPSQPGQGLCRSRLLASSSRSFPCSFADLCRFSFHRKGASNSSHPSTQRHGTGPPTSRQSSPYSSSSSLSRPVLTAALISMCPARLSHSSQPSSPP